MAKKKKKKKKKQQFEEFPQNDSRPLPPDRMDPYQGRERDSFSQEELNRMMPKGELSTKKFLRKRKRKMKTPEGEVIRY